MFAAHPARTSNFFPASPFAIAAQTQEKAEDEATEHVFEFENIPDSFRRLVARLGGNNVRIEGNRNMQLSVREIYTEYNPCTDTCLPLIQQNFPNARVTYSFVWELWGRQTPDRNAAVDALFAAQGQ